MNISRLVLLGALVALVATGFVFMAPLSAHTSTDARATASTAVVCEDENIPEGVTWSVKIEVHAVRNDTGQEIPRDSSADIKKWDLQCLKHKDLGHHKGDTVHAGVCLNGGECKAAELGEHTAVLTPGPYHCHVINGSVICHEY